MISLLTDIATQVLRYRLFGTRTPLVLSISVTGRCNLRCVYCYSEEDNKHAADVPTSELLRIIDEFYELGTRVFMLQGGEPLLHPDIDSIIAYIKTKRAYCSVTTNGVYFRQHLDALKKVDQVQLSIDGNEEITGANRGAGVYASLLEAIKLCDEHRIPFHLHTVLTKLSTVENTLDHLASLATSHHTYVNFCIPAPTGSAKDKHLATNNQVHDLYQVILDRKHSGMPTNNSEQGLQDIIDWTAGQSFDSYISSDDTAQKHRYPKCIMGDLVCWLDSSGMLHPCAIRFGQQGFAYSIKEHGIKGAWGKLRTRPCHCCAGSTEFNNLFRFRPGAVLNSLKFILKKARR